ncbi:hypothetical protein OUZ56_031952 [Daphnia magna]|uniref:Uncharacterized protein n=1 Tax=Daphnia magna TaxID=35525 RepID=A0ABQ9ZVS5_9CRUS|nr:hypothetical protein OUZ56_031952 [Daphnia magna]
MMRFRSVGTPRCPSREYNNEDNHRKRGGQEKEHKKTRPLFKRPEFQADEKLELTHDRALPPKLTVMTLSSVLMRKSNQVPLIPSVVHSFLCTRSSSTCPANAAPRRVARDTVSLTNDPKLPIF